MESNSSSDNTKIYAGVNFIIENSSASGDFYFKNGSTGVNVLAVTPGGNLTITGSQAKKSCGTNTWDISSDRRLKKNITPYTDGLNELLKIEPINFQYNGLAGQDSTQTYIGVIAQDLRKIAPYMVYGEEGPNNYLTINNSAMTYMLINAVKELASENQTLRLQLQDTEAKIDQIWKELDNLKAVKDGVSDLGAQKKK